MRIDTHSCRSQTTGEPFIPATQVGRLLGELTLYHLDRPGAHGCLVSGAYIEQFYLVYSGTSEISLLPESWNVMGLR